MSRIKLNELNQTSLEVLDNNATSEVIGGSLLIGSLQLNLAAIQDNDAAVNVQGGIFNFAAVGNTSVNTIGQSNS